VHCALFLITNAFMTKNRSTKSIRRLFSHRP